jgi:hypothetical protein
MARGIGKKKEQILRENLKIDKLDRKTAKKLGYETLNEMLTNEWTKVLNQRRAAKKIDAKKMKSYQQKAVEIREQRQRTEREHNAARLIQSAYRKLKARYVGTVTIPYKYQLNDGKGRCYPTVHYDQDVYPFDTKKLGGRTFDKFVKDCYWGTYTVLAEDSKIAKFKILDTKIDKHEYREPRAVLAKLPMKDAFHLHLDGEQRQVWDTNKGTCVIDYIKYTYGGVKGFISLLQSDTELRIILRGAYDPVTHTYEYPEPVEQGVCTEQIAIWCKKFGVPMYACDENEKLFMIVNEDTDKKFRRNHNCQAMSFRIMNGHFYPFEDEKQRRSIQRQAAGVKSDNANVCYKRKREDVTKDGDANGEIEVVETENTKEFFASKIDETKTLPYPFNSVKYNGKDILQFTLEGKTYMLNQDIKLARQVCENIGKEFKGQSLSTIMFDIIEELYGEDGIPKSTPNPHVFKTLTEEAVKARTHYGCVNGCTDTIIRNEWMKGNVQVCDIRKQYTSCMYEPKEDWIVLGFNDDWEEYDGKLSLGLYYVKTEDTTLMHGDNIYSTSMLKKARQENIKFQIVAQLKPSQRKEKTLFKKVLEKFVEVSKGDTAISKTLANMLSGFLGRHKTRTNTLNLNTNYEQVLNWFNRNGQKGKRISIEHIDIAGQRFYMYGHITETMLSSNNLPNYIQIKDDANIRLYDMIKAMGGTLAFRKTDLAITIGGKYPKLSDEWGGYRQEEPPLNMGECHYKTLLNLNWKLDWVHHKHIKNSSQWEEMLKIAKKEGGLLIEGEAGVGKTFASKNIGKALGDRVKRLAFTHQACLFEAEREGQNLWKMDQGN